MEYRVPSHDEPTLFNRDAGMGALIGSFLPIPFGTLIGGAIGGFIGKNRMEKERAEGRPVKEPSTLDTLFSKESAIDGWIGNIGGSILGGIVAAVVAPHAIVLGMTIATLGAVAGTLMGVFHGADKAKQRMHNEYAQAAAMDNAGRGRSLSQQVEYDRTPTRSFAAQIDAERQQSAVVQR